VPQIFGRRANGLTRLILFSALVFVIFAATGGTLILRSAAYTGVGMPVTQPVPFSHAHHVGDLGIDCRYCHTSVETSADAGLPATSVCMTCHSEIWTHAAMLAPIRQSLATGRPIAWNRVYDLPDFVFFDHSIHVAKGVACVTCHGPIDRMPLTRLANPMQMSWCLGCHRDPAPNIRPREAVFDPEWTPPADVAALHQKLFHDYGIDPTKMTDCYVCHR
jgi:hypothetical protein